MYNLKQEQTRVTYNFKQCDILFFVFDSCNQNISIDLSAHCIRLYIDLWSYRLDARSQNGLYLFLVTFRPSEFISYHMC